MFCILQRSGSDKLQLYIPHCKALIPNIQFCDTLSITNNSFYQEETDILHFGSDLLQLYIPHLKILIPNIQFCDTLGITNYSFYKEETDMFCILLHSGSDPLQLPSS